MKTKAIVAMLLIVAAASADARFAWSYPRKAVSPDESELAERAAGTIRP